MVSVHEPSPEPRNRNYEAVARARNVRNFEIFGRGNSLTLPDGSIAVWSGTRVQRSFGAPEIFGISVTLATNIGTNLVSNWQYDKLKGQSAILRINRTEVEIEPNKIRIVIEQIERKGL